MASPRRNQESTGGGASAMNCLAGKRTMAWEREWERGWGSHQFREEKGRGVGGHHPHWLCRRCNFCHHFHPQQQSSMLTFTSLSTLHSLVLVFSSLSPSLSSPPPFFLQCFFSDFPHPSVFWLFAGSYSFICVFWVYALYSFASRLFFLARLEPWRADVEKVKEKGNWR